MARRRHHVLPLNEQVRITHGKLLNEMCPLERDLIRANDYGPHRSDRSHLGTIERITAPACFVVNRGEVRVDGRARMLVILEPLKLGMASVAARFPPKNRPSQQSLAPQSNQSLWVKILGVQRP
jgi:hypothetical protein